MLRLPSSGCSSPTPTRPLVRPPGPGERPHSPRRVPQDLCRHRGRFLPRTRGRRPKDVRAASSQPHLPWGSSVVRPCALPPRRAALQKPQCFDAGAGSPPGPSAALTADSARPRPGRGSRGTHHVWSSMGKIATEAVTGTLANFVCTLSTGGQSCISFSGPAWIAAIHLSLLGRTKVFPGVCGHDVCDLLSDVQQRIQDLRSLGARRGRWRALVVPAPGAGRQTSSVKGQIATVPGPAALRRLSLLNSTAACDRSPDSTRERAWPSSAEAVCAQTGSHQAGCCRGGARESRPSGRTSSQTHCWGEAGGPRQKETLGGHGGAQSGEPCCSSWGAGAQGAMPGQRPPPQHARPGLSMSSSACGFVLSTA
ncbi:zinc finger protein 41 homolog isoform X1 [Mustela putorius furo]|uniref:Zinc finger protein 41 homolog isoform X1 n=1 Tax=Mustela putorius furo TaxID=9669 RepID=A0A8U0NGE5_MUSPF|nr:zinc finger protein 41 homolog isoform X1 [Mustela putorius furo]